MAIAAFPPPRHSSAQDGAQPSFLATLIRRLIWRSVPADGVASSDAMISVCATAAVAIWLAFDRFAAGSGAYWYTGGLAGISWYAAGVLALAWVLHRGTHGASGFRAILASIVATLPLALVLALAVHTWAPGGARVSAYAVVCLVVAAHLRRSLVVSSGESPRLAVLAAVLWTLVFVWATNETWVDSHFWYAAEGEEDDSDYWAEGERLLFEQSDRIDAAAARLRAGEPDRADVYFLGLAGVGEEKVFAEEIQLAQQVISERYGAGDRSLLLVNDRRDRDTYPMATVGGLRRGLTRLGERMDRSEDVLFLMLTSHGSAEPSLSISNEGWPLQQLDADMLRSALDDALIKWRVIVISACYSGAFIEPLADENTIVLTSAAADRTSFGCSDDREVTEFGAALLRDALPHAPTLASAFDQAKQALAEREQQEGIAASLPQAHFGRVISSYWERVEKERTTRRYLPSNSAPAELH